MRTQNTYRYYTKRPVLPGTLPSEENTINVHNYEKYTYIPESDLCAWGYAEYDHPLSEKDIENFELIQDGYPYYAIVIMETEHIIRARVEPKCVRSLVAPESEAWLKNGKRFRKEWYQSIEEAKKALNKIKKNKIKGENCMMKTPDSILVWNKEVKALHIAAGSGCNLLREDIANGYVDYIMIEPYVFDETEMIECFDYMDGGQCLLTEYYNELFGSSDEVIKYLIDEGFIPDVCYEILYEG